MGPHLRLQGNRAADERWGRSVDTFGTLDVLADRRPRAGERSSRNWSPARLAAACAVLAVLYYAAAKLGLSLALLNASASAVWPPTGLALAAVLLLGPRVWPGIFVGALVANETTTGNLPTSLAIACGNTLEGLVGAFLVTRFAGGRRAFERAGDVFRFALLAGVASPVLSATIGVTSLAAAGFVPRATTGDVWLTWWLGDAVGAWIVAPLLLAWAERPARWRQERARVVEGLLLGACLALVGWLVFFEPGRPDVREPMKFLCLPPLLWAAFRFSRRTVASAVLLVAAFALAGRVRGLGELGAAGANESLLMLQAFLGVAALTAHVVRAMVGEHRRAEHELRARTLALRRSNEDLEQFAAAASHDLQEPLRMVTSYMHLLARRYGGRAGPEADEYVRHAVAGAERMRELIDALLAYARLDSAGRGFARVECEAALHAALANVELAARESKAQITHDPLPAVRGDESQLVQLFQNLLGNALKFHEPGAAPRIHVGARPREREWLLSVSDEGIGMEPRDSERIFQVFQRLHHREEYPGVGIGLALCKRIVERHGGRIWVEARPGEGCTFRFTLPAAEGPPSPGSRD